MSRQITFIAFLLLLRSTQVWAQTLTESHLPIIIIQTNGQTISSEPVQAQFEVVDNPGGQVNRPNDSPAYEGLISIRYRGHYSSILPQKPYAIETLNITGLDTSVALLGMPAEEDWVLLANWNDKSLIRNSMMFDLARAAGQWAPHTRHVEVLLNGHYEGVYVFCEKIKRDNDRVAVKKLDPNDNELPKLSGGYIFKRDYAWDFITYNWFPANCPDRRLNFEIVYPDIDDISPRQLQYIADYMDQTEKALFSSYFTDPETGYRHFLDVESWVDYFLLGELSGNVDAYKKSMFFHKDRGGLLKLGPIWDFDWALKFLVENSFPNGAGWLYKVDPCSQDLLYVPYFQRLLQDTFFQNRVCNRWQSLRSHLLDTDRLLQYIDSAALVLDVPKNRHFQRWQCLGYDSGAPELPPYPGTYAGEIDKLKLFLLQRLNWMDAQLPLIACPQPLDSTTIKPYIKIMPNPGQGHFSILTDNLPKEGIKGLLYDSQGRLCMKIYLIEGLNPLDLSAYPSSTYFLRVEGFEVIPVMKI